ncbi:MAG: HIT family protein [Holosporales bacterium]|jgi:diadenosine tetraphosphate (Ap4A) HIT family hydrolase|nr:HIT family protein [Holosporales bacterium]
MFELLDAFKKKEFIRDLKLCKTLMEDKEYPWILLIPMRDNIMQINQLSEEDSVQLMKEIRIASKIMNELFDSERLNIAAIGNKTPQLHIHIISRKSSDSLWPKTVWGMQMKKLTDSEKIDRADKIRESFSKIEL